MANDPRLDELHQLTKAALVKRLRQQEQDRKEERQNYVTFLRMLGIIIAILLSVGIYVMCFSSGRNGQDVSLGGDAKIAKGVVTMDVMMYDERDRIAMIRRETDTAHLCTITYEDYEHLKWFNGPLSPDGDGLVFPRTFYEALGLVKGPAALVPPAPAPGEQQHQQQRAWHIEQVLGAAIDSNVDAGNIATWTLYKIISVFGNAELRGLYDEVFWARLPPAAGVGEKKRSSISGNWIPGGGGAIGGGAPTTKARARIEWLDSICGGRNAGSGSA